MGLFVYDMIQDVFLKHLHYHQHDESMALLLPKSKIFYKEKCLK